MWKWNFDDVSVALRNRKAAIAWIGSSKYVCGLCFIDLIKYQPSVFIACFFTLFISVSL